MRRVLCFIVHHRGADMLSLCLESLLQSASVEIEIVVVNNGCEEELPPLASSSRRVHEVRSSDPLGFSEANNLGVDWALANLEGADLLYFVNNDTLSHGNALRLQVEALDEHPNVAITGPQLVIWGAEGYLNSLGINVTRDAWGWDEGIGIARRDYGPLPETRPVLAVTGSALLMRSQAFERVGGWTELYDYYFEDIDLCLKARRFGHDVLNVPGAVVRHGISATMTEGSDRKDHYFWRNRLLLGFAHWPLALWPELLGRAVGRDILLRPAADRSRPRRALVEALPRLPRAWRLRRSVPSGPSVWSWTEHLRPSGSVPPITLPEVCYLPLEARIGEGGTGSTSLGVVDPGSESEAAPSQAMADSGPESEWLARSGRRVLVLGWSPLPFDDAEMNYAPGVRAWQLARSLAEDGHRVLLVTARMPGTGPTAGSTGPGADTFRDGVRIQALTWPDFEAVGGLESLVDDFAPELLVGATPLPARRAAGLAGNRPLWIDLFGDPMSEAQSKAAVAGGEHATAYRDLLSVLLSRGDAFSAVSERQKWAVVGQLGLAGRLTAEVAGIDLVHTIPCSSQSVHWSTDGEIPQGVVEDGDFVVLWSGGFNTWCDVDTLFEGLESAMAQAPDLHFVATGGDIEGHDETTYPRFVALVETSQHAERYHLLGRRSKPEADAWVRRAQLGIVTEKTLYERALGSSQRLAGWLAAGLPFVCTEESELGQQSHRRGCSLSYRTGDSKSLAAALIGAVRSPIELEECTAAGAQWVSTEASDSYQTSALRDWVAGEGPGRTAAARRVLDPSSERSLLQAEVKRLFRDLRGTERALEASRKHQDWLLSETERLGEFEQEFHAVRAELGGIHESRMWRVWMVILKLRALFRV